MKFPADEAGNAVLIFHGCSLVNPMVGLGADPIGAAGARRYIAPRADQLTFRRTLVRKSGDRRESADHSFVTRTEVVNSAKDSVG